MSNILIPVAISSQLDESGEERIHAATANTNEKPVYILKQWVFVAVDNV